MIRRLIAGAGIALALALGACASTTPGLETMQQRAYAAQADYFAALQVAVAYESQPRCTPGQSVLDACSQASVVAEIRRAENDAFAAVNAAVTAARNPLSTSSTVGASIAAAEAAVGALRQILTNRGVLRR